MLRQLVERKNLPKFVMLVLIAAVIVLTPCTEALAGVRITLVNRTGSTVVAGYFSHHDNPRWGDDQLSEYIYPGESYVVDFEPAARYWDCKFVLKNGRETYKYNLDIHTIGTLYIDL